MNIYLFQRILGVGMIFFQILILSLVIYIFYKKVTKKEYSVFENIFNKKGLFLIFGASLFSVIISLIFSDYYQIEPCKLCWIQRICLYPQLLISAIALFHQKEDRKLSWIYIKYLSLIGILFALYQTLEQFSISFLPKAKCVIGPDAACSQVHMLEFGYITFPFCSVCVFLFIILISFLSNKK